MQPAAKYRKRPASFPFSHTCIAAEALLLPDFPNRQHTVSPQGAHKIVPFILIEPINPNTGTFLLLLAITAGIVVAYICKRKRLPWTTVLLLLFAAGNIAVTVMGAPDDYGRLQLPSFPAELLLLGLTIRMIEESSFLKNDLDE